MSEDKIRVLIVDDSAAIRQLLTSILSSDPQIEVVGTASDPYFAREKVVSLKPDVMTLDVEMPRMDGLTFLDKLMRGHPMPVVMVSSLTQQNCDITLRALEIGAVDFFPKPTIDTLHGVRNGARQIIEKVKTAAQARVFTRAPRARSAAEITPPRTATSAFRMTHQLIAIGASTGGTEAIGEVLTAFPAATPGIVVTQHMPPGFTTSFANRLDGLCAIRVKEAEAGDRVLPGHALIAPGNFHMIVVRSGSEYFVKLSSGPPVNRHRPSVDVMFDSCAEQGGRNVVSAILTGMGDDGARGMRRIRDAGGRTIAQNEATCVVYGMPKEAVAHGGVESILPLNEIAPKLLAVSATVAHSMRHPEFLGER